MVRAAEHGPPEAAWRLAGVLRGYLYMGRCLVDLATVSHAGMTAASTDGSPLARAMAHLCVATLNFALDQDETADDHYTRAMALARAAGWGGPKASPPRSVAAATSRWKEAACGKPPSGTPRRWQSAGAPAATPKPCTSPTPPCPWQAAPTTDVARPCR